MSHIDRDTAQRAIDAKTKPLGALGRLEEIAVRLSVLQNTLSPQLARARIGIFAADHGIADEGVSAYPRAVTAEMMKNFARGGAAINVLARTANVEVEVIDVGVDADLQSFANIRHAKLRRGTRNFLHEPAMTATELDAAMAIGAAIAGDAVADGVAVLGFGEMGIGNTTSAAALLMALTRTTVAETVGRGTGIDDAVLAHKRSVVTQALALHDASTPREWLRCVGGLEIAAIAGAALEAATRGIAIVADGFISTVAILSAAYIANPAQRADLSDALFFSHRSSERGHALALAACGEKLHRDAAPLLDLNLRLGEGTGAALVIPILRSAAAVMREMATFAEAGVSAGEHGAQHSVDG